MFRRSRSLTVAALAAAALASLVPSAGAAIPCRAVGTITTGSIQTVVVAGAYSAAGALDVRLTCGVVRDGQTVARFTDTMSGPVAVVEGTADISAGPFTACYELTVRYVDGRFTSADHCP